MTMTDPIADMLTRIRNANLRGKTKVNIPSSRLKLELARIMKEEAFIDNYTMINDNRQGILRVYLRYGPGKARVLRNLKRVSTPGRRVYVHKDEIPRVLGGMGVSVISTSKGILTDDQARTAGVGGEVLCHIW